VALPQPANATLAAKPRQTAGTSHRRAGPQKGASCDSAFSVFTTETHYRACSRYTSAPLPDLAAASLPPRRTAAPDGPPRQAAGVKRPARRCSRTEMAACSRSAAKTRKDPSSIAVTVDP
jgi:hypothetical protein